jgi:uncharacterized membrane protein YphA (DoxX/SURF4 family)
MKKTKIIYWISTGLLLLFMTASSIPDVMNDPDAIKVISTHLGYPPYFVPLIGIAKLLGVIAILIPGFPRVKEWAYAGFVFDLGGAIYSLNAVGDPFSDWWPLLIGIAFIAVSYVYHHKMLREKSASLSN